MSSLVIPNSNAVHLSVLSDEQIDAATQRAIDGGVQVTWRDGIHRQTPESLFHLTARENVQSILDSGLRPSLGDLSREFGDDARAVYMFGSVEAAHACIMEGFFLDMGDYRDEVVLLRIQSSGVPDLEQQADRRNWEWMTRRPIAPEAVAEMWSYDTSAIVNWDE